MVGYWWFLVLSIASLIGSFSNMADRHDVRMLRLTFIVFLFMWFVLNAKWYWGWI